MKHTFDYLHMYTLFLLMLQELEVPYVEINLDLHSDRKQEMQEISGRSTVPQIFFNEVTLAGFVVLSLSAMFVMAKMDGCHG